MSCERNMCAWMNEREREKAKKYLAMQGTRRVIYKQTHRRGQNNGIKMWISFEATLCLSYQNLVRHDANLDLAELCAVCAVYSYDWMVNMVCI